MDTKEVSYDGDIKVVKTFNNSKKIISQFSFLNEKCHGYGFICDNQGIIHTDGFFKSGALYGIRRIFNTKTNNIFELKTCKKHIEQGVLIEFK